LDRDDALAHAISNAEAADRLLAADEALAGAMPGGRARDADMGPYGVFEQQRLARFAGATAHAETAQAWAAIALQLPTRGETHEQVAQTRQRDDADRRARS
jgi:hypothetical protein